MENNKIKENLSKKVQYYIDEIEKGNICKVCNNIPCKCEEMSENNIPISKLTTILIEASKLYKSDPIDILVSLLQQEKITVIEFTTIYSEIKNQETENPKESFNFRSIHENLIDTTKYRP